MGWLKSIFPAKARSSKGAKDYERTLFYSQYTAPSCFAGLKFASVCFAALRLCGKNILFSQPLFNR
jgi:hypothetical protein